MDGERQQRPAESDLGEPFRSAKPRSRRAVGEIGDGGESHRRRRERDQDFDDGKSAIVSSRHRTREHVDLIASTGVTGFGCHARDGSPPRSRIGGERRGLAACCHFI